MKKAFPILLLFLLFYISGTAQSSRSGPGWYYSKSVIADADTTNIYYLYPVYCFRKPADLRKYTRLIQNVKKVYPVAKEARRRLELMETEILELGTQQEQRKYIRQMEKDIKKEYEPVLRRMTRSQGKILIKLIDRETDRTSYQIVKELRGGFRAVFWQGIARIFGANLKDRYDKDGEDQVIEQIILLYEAGLI